MEVPGQMTMWWISGSAQQSVIPARIAKGPVLNNDVLLRIYCLILVMPLWLCGYVFPLWGLKTKFILFICVCIGGQAHVP